MLGRSAADAAPEVTQTDNISARSVSTSRGRNRSSFIFTPGCLTISYEQTILSNGSFGQSVSIFSITGAEEVDV